MRGDPMNVHDPTTPYVNLASKGSDFAAYTEEYSQVCSLYREAGMKPVEFIKSKLGRQDYCYSGEFRYWVWERESPNLFGEAVFWRIYVSNKKGIGFEVAEGTGSLAARQAWNHFQEALGLSRVLTADDIFRGLMRDYVESVVRGTAYISGYTNLEVEDDGDPEGGVRVTVDYKVSRCMRREIPWAKAEEWARGQIEGRIPFWSQRGERQFSIDSIQGPEESDLVLRTKFFYPGPRLRASDYMALAHRIWKAHGGEVGWGTQTDFEDEVIRICVRGDYLETVRLSNKNPTTMAPITSEGLGKPIRHHGEHIYLTKHLLTLAEEA